MKKCKYVLLSLLLLIVGCSGSTKTKKEIVCPNGSTLRDGFCRFDCPEKWNREEDSEQCLPPCPEGFDPLYDNCAPPCPVNMVPKDDILCQPDGLDDVPGSCKDGLFDTTGLAGRAIYVDPKLGSDEDNQGGQMDPFKTLSAALGAINAETDTEVSIILGRGEYPISDMQVTHKITSLKLLGKCADETFFTISPNKAVVFNSAETSVEIARIGFIGGTHSIWVNNLKKLSITDSRFQDWLGQAGAVIWSGSKAEESLTIKHSLFSASTSVILNIINIEEIVVQKNKFNLTAEGSDNDIDFSGAKNIEISGNTIANTLSDNGIHIQFDQKHEKTVISNNLLKGSWSDNAIKLLGDLISHSNQSSIEIANNSIENEINNNYGNAALQGIALQNLTIIGLRTKSQADHSMALEKVGNVHIENSVFTGGTENTIFFDDCTSATIDTAYIAGSKQSAGIYFKGADTSELVVSNSTITRNPKGLRMSQGFLTAKNNAIGANSSFGIQLKDGSNLTIQNNVLASNASTGIDLISLSGTSQDVYLISDNTIMESVGLGISARSTGDGLIDITNNQIYGILPGSVTNASVTGTVGDGIGILTGTDEIPSKARLANNNVHGNIRLGVIVHGQGTTAEVSGVNFGEGNGYSRSLDNIVDNAPDLLYQNDALLTGTGADIGQDLGRDTIFVADDPSSDAPVFASGGIDIDS